MERRGNKVDARPDSPIRRWISATLAVLLLFLSFASVSPELHDSFQAEASCASECASDSHNVPDESEDSTPHVCAVELFNMGADYPATIEISSPTLLALETISYSYDFSWSDEPVRSHSARAPPIESVVSA